MNSALYYSNYCKVKIIEKLNKANIKNINFMY